MPSTQMILHDKLNASLHHELRLLICSYLLKQLFKSSPRCDLRESDIRHVVGWRSRYIRCKGNWVTTTVRDRRFCDRNCPRPQIILRFLTATANYRSVAFAGWPQFDRNSTDRMTADCPQTAQTSDMYTFGQCLHSSTWHCMYTNQECQWSA